MISASRSYQNNVEVMNTAKTLLQKTLQMGQSWVRPDMTSTVTATGSTGSSASGLPRPRTTRRAPTGS